MQNMSPLLCAKSSQEEVIWPQNAMQTSSFNEVKWKSRPLMPRCNHMTGHFWAHLVKAKLVAFEGRVVKIEERD